ncbi:hypothetical protein O181_113494 [Austropuccinia psidii MF-1]|uniref:Reverse transcriptase domain-containing protein n=1 Tax=Austropuccinia psidii MF-1 TaxID=1389203 RepID=A0A9Q3K3N2_9BASI|nr:hypothetical protein [Austropuccinia psidii MF-1]
MDYQNSAAKSKSVLKKVKPVNEPMPQEMNPPLGRPTLSRDPFNTPLSPKPPKFLVTSKITQEIFELINVGPPGRLSEEERSLLMSVIVLREKEIAFSAEKRGLLKHSYEKPYKIPVIPHTPWQNKLILIPKPTIPQLIELLRESIRKFLYEQSLSSYTSPVFCVAKSNGELRIFHEFQDINKVTTKDAGIPPHIEEFVDDF